MLNDSNALIIPAPYRKLFIICYSLSILFLAVTAYVQLSTLIDGHLFAFAIQKQQAANKNEILDAQESARYYLWPAVLVVILCSLALLALLRKNIFNFKQFTSIFYTGLGILFLATCADLYSTILFFHHLGIDHEAHPGIRLFGYAYGRSLGPIIGKSLQLFAILYLCLLCKRYAVFICSFVSLIYFFAAYHNFNIVANM